MTTTVHAEVDENVENEARAVLAEAGLTSSDAFRLMLIWIAWEKLVPIELWNAAKREGVIGQMLRPLTPNAETAEAMETARRGELSGPFSSVDELMKHLHAED